MRSFGIAARWGWLLASALVAAGSACEEGRPTSSELPVLQSPTRLALSPGGGLFVSDLRQVVLLDAATLQPVDGFAVNGESLGIAVRPALAGDLIYVGNASRHRVQVYDTAGAHQFDLGGSVARPNEIAIDASRHEVFVTDTDRGLVRVFDAEGPPLRTIPETIDPRVLAAPTGLALDREAQQVLVADYGDPRAQIPPRVQVFGYDGSLHFTIEHQIGRHDRSFWRPQGIALDGAGHVFVVDCVSSSVSVLDRWSGEIVGVRGGRDDAANPLQFPLDVAVDPRTRDLFVTNRMRHSVERLAATGVPE